MIDEQKGQTLIEALVSLSIAVVIISAITVVVISSLNNATFTRNQNQATQYAQEGIEITKRISVSETPIFNSINNGVYCLDEGKSLLDEPRTNPGLGKCGFNVNIGGSFSREVELFHGDPQCSGNTKVIVRVEWSDNKCQNSSQPFCHEVALSSCFSDYNPSSTSGKLL